MEHFTITVVVVTLNQEISSYNPSLLEVDPTSNGAELISFTYAFMDENDSEDLTPATAEIYVILIQLVEQFMMMVMVAHQMEHL
jgi:hypothetical protein